MKQILIYHEGEFVKHLLIWNKWILRISFLHQFQQITCHLRFFLFQRWLFLVVFICGTFLALVFFDRREFLYNDLFLLFQQPNLLENHFICKSDLSFTKMLYTIGRAVYQTVIETNLLIRYSELCAVSGSRHTNISIRFSEAKAKVDQIFFRKQNSPNNYRTFTYGL